MSQGSGTAQHVFVSYVREDARRVDRLQGLLEATGITVWRDTSHLWPGQDWKIEIRGAIESGAAFIACFSEHTARREASYQNSELSFASDEMRRRPPGRVWLLPVRFAECTLPPFDLGAGRTLDSLHRVDLFDSAPWDPGVARLAVAVRGIRGAPEAKAARSKPRLAPSASPPSRKGPEGGRFARKLDNLFANSPRPMRGANVEAEATLSSADAARGTVVTLRLPGLSPCSTCRGTGVKAKIISRSCPTCGGGWPDWQVRSHQAVPEMPRSRTGRGLPLSGMLGFGTLG